MYIPADFEETDSAEIQSLIEVFPFSSLVCHTKEGLVVNHLPLLMIDDVLIGHLSKQNHLCERLNQGDEVLAIFQGEDAYISPNWYPSKEKHHRSVPTWNYQVVHVYGTISFSHEEKAKRAAVGRVTKKMESLINGEHGWKMSDAPTDYMEKMLEQVVAVEICITKTIGKSKLSQNRDKEDYLSVKEHLKKVGKSYMSGKMSKYKD